MQEVNSTSDAWDFREVLAFVSNLKTVSSLVDSNLVLSKKVDALTNELRLRGSSKQKRFYNLKEAAEALNASETTVRRYLDRGLLRRSSAQGKIQIPAAEIESFGARTV